MILKKVLEVCYILISKVVTMNVHEKINYIELPSKNIEKTKSFFTQVFGWEFTDYGSDYTSFINEGLNGGFYKSKKISSPINGSALLVFFSNDLASTQIKITNAGGAIIKSIFSFPGGARFHFSDTNGNEYAVWSDKSV